MMPSGVFGSGSWLPYAGTQFTCFTSTKVQILTQQHVQSKYSVFFFTYPVFCFQREKAGAKMPPRITIAFKEPSGLNCPCVCVCVCVCARARARACGWGGGGVCVRESARVRIKMQCMHQAKYLWQKNISPPMLIIVSTTQGIEV